MPPMPFRSRPARALASWPAGRFVDVQIANGFGDHGDRLVVLPPEGRSPYRLAKRLWKLIPVVTAKDSWRLHKLRAAVSQTLAACRPLSRHRLPGAVVTRSWAKTAPSQSGRRTEFSGRTRAKSVAIDSV